MTTHPGRQHHANPWRPLYITGGIAALLATFVFRRNLGAELMLIRNLFPGTPQAIPADAIGWFSLLRQHPLIGLTLFEVFDLVEYALVGIIFLAVCAASWPAPSTWGRTKRGMALLATVCGWAGIISYFASNPAFAMLALSGRYAAAATDAQRAVFQATGEALLAVYNPAALHQGARITLCMLLVPLAGLILSLVMLRGGVFNKATAVTGILANAILLCYFPVLAFAPALLVLPFVLSAPLRVTWYFLIALKLFQLAKETK